MIGLGIPIFDNVPAEAIAYLLRLGIEMSEVSKQQVYAITVNNIVPYDKARNTIVDEAIKKNIDTLVFVDSDMIIPAGSFTKLWKVFKERKEPLVSGHAYRRGYPFTCIWSKVIGENAEGGITQVDAESGVHEIDGTGMFFCLIDLKWVRENLEKPYFFQGWDEHGVQQSEDIYFCNKIRKAGGKVLGIADLECGHIYAKTIITRRNVEGLRKEFLMAERELVS